jgi:hypothetical protein
MKLLHFLQSQEIKCRLKNAFKFNVKQRYFVGTTCKMTKFVFKNNTKFTLRNEGHGKI